jgi:hypothetical protein
MLLHLNELLLADQDQIFHIGIEIGVKVEMKISMMSNTNTNNQRPASD